MQLPSIDKKYLIIGGAVLSVIILAIIIILVATRKPNNVTPQNGDPKKEEEQKVDTAKQGTLTIWGVFDDSAIWQPIIKEFNKTYPNIKVIYSKKNYADYEASLIDAIASGSGPDILNLHNDWLPKHKSKLEPANKDVISADAFQEAFIPVAFDDFVDDGKVYGVPITSDSLALYYNQDLFQAASIYQEPKTWNDVLAYSKLLTKKVAGDPSSLSTGGIAFGAADNVARANDILLALMLQTGTTMSSKDHRTFTFNQFYKDQTGTPQYPGTNALNFYTAFANPTKDAYAWNADMGNSVDAFAQGKVAMMVGYSYSAPVIEKANPSLNYKIVALPQLKGAPETITLANYWGWSVSKASGNKDVAWQFLRFLSTNVNAQQYIVATGRPSALKSMSGTANRVFEDQKLYAKSTFKGSAEEFDKIFLDMINDVTKFNQPTQSAIDTAARKANEMLEKYQ